MHPTGSILPGSTGSVLLECFGTWAWAALEYESDEHVGYALPCRTMLRLWCEGEEFRLSR
jgi:hypothetical protein